MGTNIGFIGTGVITTALVTGLCSENDVDHRIFLSPRNLVRASSLASKFDNVTVAGSNQEVIDKSEWVILAILPRLGEDIIRPLSFRNDHRVINLMADIKLDEIESWIGKTKTLAHMVPLPFASKRIGPIAIYPNDKDIASLFSPLGQIIGVDEPKQMQVLAAITALMGPYFTLLWEVVKWGESKGLSRKESTEYTTSFFEALSYLARYAEDGDIGRLAGEMTPGGLNEMALSSIKEQHGFNPWIKALDPVLARLRK